MVVLTYQPVEGNDASILGFQQWRRFGKAVECEIKYVCSAASSPNGSIFEYSRLGLLRAGCLVFFFPFVLT